MSREKNIYEASKLMLKNIFPKKINIKKNARNRLFYIIQPNEDSDVFTSKSLFKIAKDIKSYLKVNKSLPIDIYLDIRRYNTFKDKNTYLLLDLIIYNLVIKSNSVSDIYILHNFNNIMLSNNINTGIMNTAFFRSLYKINDDIKLGYKVDKDIFSELYVKKTTYENPELYNFLVDEKKPSFYRLLLVKGDYNDELESKIFTDISNMLSWCFDDEDWVADVSEVIVECISNFHKHNELFLLIDIDISDNLYTNSNNYSFKGLNLSIINLGENYLYSEIEKNFKNNSFDKSKKIYNNVYKAYKNHIGSFDHIYTEQHFFMVTAFQYRVSTRYQNKDKRFIGKVSGTGLPAVVKNITEKTYQDISYVVSNDKIIMFKDNLLNYKDDLIGFNLESDYINKVPDKKALSKSFFKIPGTAYQFHLIQKRG